MPRGTPPCTGAAQIIGTPCPRPGNPAESALSMPRRPTPAPPPLAHTHCAWPSHPRAVRTNRLESAAVIAFMIALAVPLGIGGAIALAAARDEARDTASSLPHALAGAAIAL